MSYIGGKTLYNKMADKKGISIFKKNTFLKFISQPIWWVMPIIILLMIFYIYPIIYSIFMSFNKWQMTGQQDAVFIGLKNFKDMFFNDFRFLATLRNTSVLILVALVFELFLGFFLGIILSINLKGKGIFRIITMIPIFIMPIVAAGIWRSFFNFDGIINIVLSFFKIPPIEWLVGFPNGIISAAIVDIWQWTSFVALIIVAAIESSAREPYEAAVIDGASTRQVLIHITIPLLKYIIIVILLLRAIDLIKFFEIMLLLTGGGPGYTTETTSMYIFRMGLKEFRIGYASSLSWILVIITIIIMTLFIRFLHKNED